MAGNGPGMPGIEYKDYYAVLGIARTASQAEVKKTFRKLARQHHPDAKPGDQAAERRFKEINEANEVLGDPAKRRQYDQLGANWEQISRAGGQEPAGNPFAGFAGSGGNVRYEFRTSSEPGEFSDFFRVFFGDEVAQSDHGSGGPARGTRPVGGMGFQDILAGMGLGGRGADGSSGAPGAGARTGSAPPPAHEAQAEISLAEAYHGTTRLVEIDGKRLEVTVPRGADSGTRIRLSGKAPGGADLFVAIRQLPDAQLTRRGADLERELPLTLREALLGAEVKVETPRGGILLKIPAGTQTGRTFRLTGQGMPRFNASGHGDLYVRARVVLPTTLSDDAEEAAGAFFDLVDQPCPR